MSSIGLFGYAVVALLVVQGAFLLLAPHRAAQFTLWKYRLIGAQLAQPGSGTFLLYRIGGGAMLVAATYILMTLLKD